MEGVHCSNGFLEVEGWYCVIYERRLFLFLSLTLMVSVNLDRISLVDEAFSIERQMT